MDERGDFVGKIALEWEPAFPARRLKPGIPFLMEGFKK